MKKNKIVLHAIGNNGNFNYYIFDKKHKVAIELSNLFSKIFDLYWDFHENYVTKSGVYKQKKINIEKYKDEHESLSSSNGLNRIDIFYGSDKMFVAVNCQSKLRLKFNEELFKISKMPNPKKLKIKLEKNKK